MDNSGEPFDNTWTDKSLLLTISNLWVTKMGNKQSGKKTSSKQKVILQAIQVNNSRPILESISDV